MVETLYVGFDGLEVAFRGSSREDVLAVLKTARDQAADRNENVLARIGSLDCQVFGAGARGGYRFMFTTGEDGETWFVKRNSGDPWRIRVSVNSLALAAHGYARVRDRLYERLAAMGAAVQEESIGRVDLAADFRIEDFTLDPAAFVAHSHSAKASECDPSVPSVHWQGRRISSVTIGKMPGRQLIIYDKRLESVRKHKAHWFDFWGVPDWRADRRPVWRVEIRAGKRELKDRWKIATWADLENQLADIVRATLADIRYTVPNDDQNVSRWPDHPLWVRVLQVMEAFLAGDGMTRAGVIRGRRIVTGQRSVKREMYNSLHIGLAASCMAVNEWADEDIGRVPDHIAGVVGDYIAQNETDFLRKVSAARQRLYLTEDEHSVTRSLLRTEATSVCDEPDHNLK